MGVCVLRGNTIMIFNETGLQNYFSNNDDYLLFTQNKLRVANIDGLVDDGYVIDIYSS